MIFDYKDNILTNEIHYNRLSPMNPGAGHNRLYCHNMVTIYNFKK